MSLLSKAGAFNSGTATAGNTVAVSGLGFQPKAVLFFWSGRTEATDTIGRATTRRGFGWVASTSLRHAAANIHTDAVDTTSGGRRIVGDACVILCSTTGANAGALDLQSFDADGFTLVVDTQMATDIRVTYLALGGTDLVAAFSGFKSEASTSASTTAVTGVGFQPNLVFIGGVMWGSGTLPGASSEARLMLGWAAGTAGAAQAVLSSRYEEPNDPTISWGYCADGICHQIAQSTTGSGAAPAHVSAFGADGYTMTWDTTGNNDQSWIYLALSVTNVAAGNISTRTDAADIAVTGLSFRPGALMFISQALAETSGASYASDEEGKWIVGAAGSPTDRGSQMSYSPDAQTGADLPTATAVEHDAVYISPTTGFAADGIMDLKSIESDGFTCVMDDTETAARFVPYLALGPGPAGSPVTLVLPDVI